MVGRGCSAFEMNEKESRDHSPPSSMVLVKTRGKGVSNRLVFGYSVVGRV